MESGFCSVALNAPRDLNLSQKTKTPEEYVNPLDFNFPKSHILLVHSTLPNCGFSIVRKKKKYPIPDAASERV